MPVFVPKTPRRVARELVHVAAAAALLVAAAPAAHAQLRDGFRGTLAPRGDDSVTPFANFGFAIDLRGESYTSASACMNGYVSFAVPLEPASCAYPGQGGAGSFQLAFLADVHGVAVAALYRDLNSAPAASGQLGFGSGTVGGRQAFGFTWDGVFSFNTTAANAVQLVFVDRAGDFGAGAFDIEYNYGALGPSGPTGSTNAVAGVADDGGFSGTAYVAPVTPAANSRVTQCFRGGTAGVCAAQVVPEPSSVMLLVAGVGALACAGAARRRTVA